MNQVLTIDFKATGNRNLTNSRQLVITSDMNLTQIEAAINDLRGRKLEVVATTLKDVATDDELRVQWRLAVVAQHTQLGFAEWLPLARRFGYDKVQIHELGQRHPELLAGFDQTVLAAEGVVVTPAKLKTSTVQEINAYDLDELIVRFYGPTNFETAAAEQMGSDDETSYVIDKIEPLDKWDAEAIEKFKADPKNTRTWPSVPALLQDMVNNSHLSPGKFLISCS